MRAVFCPSPVENFKRTNTENVQKQRDFGAIFIKFWPIFVIFFAHSFPQGVIIVPKMQERSPIIFNCLLPIPVKQAAKR